MIMASITNYFDTKIRQAKRTNPGMVGFIKEIKYIGLQAKNKKISSAAAKQKMQNSCLKNGISPVIVDRSFMRAEQIKMQFGFPDINKNMVQNQAFGGLGDIKYFGDEKKRRNVKRQNAVSMVQEMNLFQDKPQKSKKNKKNMSFDLFPTSGGFQAISYFDDEKPRKRTKKKGKQKTNRNKGLDINIDFSGLGVFK